MDWVMIVGEGGRMWFTGREGKGREAFGSMVEG